MHVKVSRILLNRRTPKFLRVILPLLLVFFLLTSNNQVAASKFVKYYAADEATVKTSPLTLSAGNSSSSSISSTYDYASITATAGLRFIENADLLVPPQAVSPSLDGSNIAQFTSQLSGSCTFTTTVANDVIYVAVSIVGTSAPVSVTDGLDTPLTQRGTVTNGDSVRCETWYKIASGAGSQTVTVSFATETSFAIVAMGVKNANVPNPFDVTSGNPMTGTGVGSTQAVTVGSVLANTLVLGSVAVLGSVTPNVGGGFASVQRSNSGGLGEGVEYKSLATTEYTTAIFTTGITSVNWVMIGDVIWGRLPSLSVDTGFSEPTTGGSAVIATMQEGYLVSPAYPRATTIDAGTWQLNLWVESQYANEELDLMLLVTDSSYNILNDVCTRVSSGPISDSPSLATVTCEQPIVNVPAGGHLVIVISNLLGATNDFVIYWGTQGLTSFKTTQLSNYILEVNNVDSTAYNIEFSVYSSLSINELTNLTAYVYSPTSTCIEITNGVFTQTSSGVLSLLGASTFYVAVNATATDFNSVSNIILLLRFSQASKPFAYDVINLTVCI